MQFSPSDVAITPFKLTKIALVIMAISLSACASSGANKQSTTNTMTVAQISVDEKLSLAAESVRNSLSDLAKAEMASQPAAKPVSNKAPPGLDTRLNVTWNGPIQQFMEKAAQLSGGYTFVSRGKVPAIPVLVTVNRKNVTLYELIRDVATQSGSRANVIIDSSDPAQRKLILEFQV
jgi:defect in organelle trafficking protein DotD